MSRPNNNHIHWVTLYKCCIKRLQQCTLITMYIKSLTVSNRRNNHFTSYADSSSSVALPLRGMFCTSLTPVSALCHLFQMLVSLVAATECRMQSKDAETGVTGVLNLPKGRAPGEEESISEVEWLHDVWRFVTVVIPVITSLHRLTVTIFT